MSGFPYTPPTSSSSTYNSNAFPSADPRFTYLTSIIPGVASMSKALVVDSTLNITGINSFGCTGSINGTSFVSNRNGNNFSFINGANSGLIELAASPNILRMVNGYAINVGSAGVTIGSGSTAAARYPIDFQNTAADFQIVFNQNGAGPTYGIGANYSQMNYTASTGHKFWKSTTGGSLGTAQFEVDANSNAIAQGNVIGNNGVFAKGFQAAGLTGAGIKMHYGGAYGELFAYDYTAGQFKDLKVGNGLYFNCTTGFCGLGASGSISFPFVVLNSISSSITGGYGYLSTSGAGTGASTGSVAVSAYFAERVFCKELDVFSDVRLKENIEPIDGTQAIEFIRKTDCISYNWIGGSKGARSLGYKAQQVIKNGLFQDIITYHPDSEMEEHVDEDGFVSPAGYKLTADYNHTVVILHKAIQVQQEQLERQQETIDELKAAVCSLTKKRRIS